MQYKLLQTDGIVEERERGGYRIVQADQPKFHVDVDFEGTEEREWPRIGFGESSNVCPAVLYEVEVPDL